MPPHIGRKTLGLVAWGAAAFCIAYALGRAALPRASQARATIRIVGDAVRHVGTYCPGTAIEEIFVLTNTGAKPLHVRGVMTSCNCTNYVIDPWEIPPGGTGTLTLTTVLPDVGEETPVDLAADVLFEGLEDRVQVVVRAEVVPEVPAVVDFGRVAPGGESLTQPLRLHFCAEPSVIVGIDSDDPAVAASVVEQASTPGGDGLIEVTLSPPSIPGTFLAALQIKVADPDRPLLEVPVRVTVAPHIEARPGTLLLGTVLAGEQHGYSMRLASTKDQVFDVTGVQCSISGLECRASALGAERTEYLLQATFTAPEVYGTISGTIEVITSQEECPSVIIPVYGVCVHTLANGIREF